MSNQSRIDHTVANALIGLVGVIAVAIITYIIGPIVVRYYPTPTETPVAIATTGPSSTAPVVISATAPPTTPSQTASTVPAITAPPARHSPTPTTTIVTPTSIHCVNAFGSHLQEAAAEIDSNGCPIGAEQPVNNYAIQQFENGWMLEPFFDRRTVYVLFDSSGKTWKSFQENWENGDHADSCPDIHEPPGNYRKPQYGLGQVWCGVKSGFGLNPDERYALGFGIHAGFGPGSAPSALYYQDFDENGMIFGGRLSQDLYQYVSCSSHTVIFILFKDGRSWDMIGGPC